MHAAEFCEARQILAGEADAAHARGQVADLGDDHLTELREAGFFGEIAGPDDLGTFFLGIDFDGGGQQVLDAGQPVAVGGVGPHHQSLHIKRRVAEGEAEVEPLPLLRSIGIEALQPVADAVDVMRQVAQVQARFAGQSARRCFAHSQPPILPVSATLKVRPLPCSVAAVVDQALCGSV